jgi:hypothetical protein
MIWKGEATAYFNLLSRHLLGGIEEKHKKPVRMVSLGVEIGTWDFPNMKQEC